MTEDEVWAAQLRRVDALYRAKKHPQDSTRARRGILRVLFARCLSNRSGGSRRTGQRQELGDCVDRAGADDGG